VNGKILILYRFRIQVKKKLGWQYEKKVVEDVDNKAQELLEENKEENLTL